jgi:hypothetical protein
MKKVKLVSVLLIVVMIIAAMGTTACVCPPGAWWCTPPPPTATTPPPTATTPVVTETATPTETSTVVPTDVPTDVPTVVPTDKPTEQPTVVPTDQPAAPVYVQPEVIKTPTPCLTCVGHAHIGETLYGPATGENLYGDGNLSMMIAWSGNFVKIEWLEPFQVVVNGIPMDSELVKGADGLDHYMIRGEFPNVVINDPSGTPWRKASGLEPWKYNNECSISASFGDTKIENGKLMLGMFPGMNPSDVAMFLRSNGVSATDAYQWSRNTWAKMKIGEYAELPGDFTPVLHQ